LTDSVPTRDQPPWPVVAYGPSHFVWNLFSGFASAGGIELASFAATLIIPLALAVGLWRRLRAAWFIAVVLAAIVVMLGIGHLLTDFVVLGLSQVAGGVVVLLLLFTTSVRRWVH
jgi:uncharacterized membrane protein (DUF2068 family)